MPQYPGTNPRMTATHSTKDDGGDRDLRVHLVPPCSSRDPRAGAALCEHTSPKEAGQRAGKDLLTEGWGTSQFEFPSRLRRGRRVGLPGQSARRGFTVSSFGKAELRQ